MAQVALALGNATAAEHALEQALASDFRVRTYPSYHLARAQLLAQHKGELDEARHT